MSDKKQLSDDDIARMIGNRAIQHLREMYPQAYAATSGSCRTSMRNRIRNDVNLLIRAFRGNERSQDAALDVFTWATDDAAGIPPELIAIEPPKDAA